MRSTRSVPLPLAGDGTLRRIVRRNLSAVLGLVLLAFAAAIAASLATWTVDDPSLSHATDLPSRNVLGVPGAIVADLVMQFFGFAGMILLLPPVVWAWRLVFGEPTRFNWKTVVSWLLATASAALALAMLPTVGTWPLPTGIGGVVGDLLLRLPAVALGGEPAGFSAVALGLAFGALAVAFGIHACGLSLRRGPTRPAKSTVPVVRPSARVALKDDEIDFDDDGELDEDADATAEDGEADDERSSRLSLILGVLAHWSFSLAGRVRRFAARHFGKRPGNMRRLFDHAFAPEPGLAPTTRGRVEPRITAADDDSFEDDDVSVVEGQASEASVLKPQRNSRVSAPAPKPKPGKRPQREAQTTLLKAPQFELPPLRLLGEPKAADKKTAVNLAALEQNARLLEGVLDDFGVRGEIINVRPGPVVTLYELEPAPGIKSARVIGLADDIARSMSAIACRVAVIPGKNAIGIELPNARRETVYLRELLAAEDFEKSKARLGLCLGKTIGGEPVIADLARMPHLLVAGTTGSGKSVSINTMILSLLYRLTPDECRLIMIDPKMLELSTYDGIPHLLTPVVTDPKQAVIALKWTVREMEDRYRKMSKLAVRNIDGYNARLAQARAKKETLTRTVQTGFARDTGEAIYEQEELSLEAMPYIVVIIDEMADLMMVAGKDIEGAVQRLAQMARAAGIHVIMATQRPSVDVITGTIKANFPTRISFQVTSKIDSRTILGEQGAEQLLGQGDMLYMMGGGRITRVHGPFVTDTEVEEVVAHLKTQGTPDYLDSITADDEIDADNYEQIAAGGGEESADLYDKAVAIVLRDRKVSTSYIQRRLAIGYNRAASIIERMEKEGVVGPANHAGKREILVGEDEDAGFR
jgi:S-DNA-T family DNA segregation ATPase FtsK/SpoIIIE